MIYFATDHRGFELKEKLKKFVADELGLEVKDFGAFSYNTEDDYPDFIRPAAEAVSKNPEHDKAIILGGSGQGEAMVANRYKGVRTVVYYGNNEKIIQLSREHNNANVLSLGAMFVEEAEAKKVVNEWLLHPFTNETRHVRRIKKIDSH